MSDTAPQFGERLHALDALRAFVLLLGIVYHAALSFVLPADGSWAVGAAEPSVALWWFIYYAHGFRMEAFFLLAGFFGALVVGKRGARTWLRDRGQRILLVFVLLVYPSTFVISMLWIDGGLRTGWLKLPAEVAALPLWRIADGGIRMHGLSGFSLGHLWFLYYLALVIALFMTARGLALRLPAAARWSAALDRATRRLLSARLAPLWIALFVWPWLYGMPRYDVDSPVIGFVPRLSALAIFGGWFVLGWWLQRQTDLLALFAARWRPLLLGGLALSVVAWGGEVLRAYGHADARIDAAARLSVALTMSLSTLGFIGLFLAHANRPSPVARYLADASYFMYLAHIPVVIALQVWWSAWPSVWGKFLAICALTFAVLLASYQLLVRNRWPDRWLNGRVAAPA